MRVNSFFKRHLSSCLMAGLIFFAVAFLFMKNDRELDPNYQKNWWTLAFASLPAPSNLSFIITNHTNTESFTYTIKNDSTLLETQEIRVPRGTSLVIQPEYIKEGSDIPVRREINAWPTNDSQNIFSIYQQ